MTSPNASTHFPEPPHDPQLAMDHPARLDGPHLRYRALRIPCGEAFLDADLALAPQPRGLVLFAHGSGSGRHSPRNRQVAQTLQRAGIATLLLDLLTAPEEKIDSASGEYRFNIALLAQRMQAVTEWVLREPELQGLALGYFGASTGSAAALMAAAQLGPRISAVVSRGGRPDLAGPAALGSVSAPTLLIVGGEDPQVVALNEEASRRLKVSHQLSIVAGATHLFEEPGALEQVASQAAAWFTTHFKPGSTQGAKESS